MVRLVFRPYTQIRRSICTSEPLRASTRVSSGFTLFRYSSPSFGSQQLCSYSNPSEHFQVGRLCTLAGSNLLLSFRAGVFHPYTRIDVRLLGPCFKTGGLQPLRQHPSIGDPRAGVELLTNSIIQPAERVATLKGRYRSPPPDADSSLPASPSLSTISRTVSLSFQSAFHLSITVLVRYRSLAGI